MRIKAFVRKHRKLLAVIVILVLVVVTNEVWEDTSAMRGRIAANTDVRRGHYKLLLYGLPPAGRPEYEQLLRERYAIETDTVAFCTPSETLRSYAEAYDQVSVDAAIRKFGRDIFKESWDSAQKAAQPRALSRRR